MILKRLVQIIAACIVIAIAIGYFYKRSLDNATGEIIIGISVLAMTFILMPVFLVYRYRKTSLKKYLFSEKKREEDKEPTDNQ